MTIILYDSYKKILYQFSSTFQFRNNPVTKFGKVTTEELDIEDLEKRLLQALDSLAENYDD